jgi:hypothetical protein
MALSPLQRQRKRERKARGKRKRQSELHQGDDWLRPRLNMSDVIQHLAQPIIDHYAPGPAELRRIILCTTMAWNVSLLPHDEQQESLVEFAAKFCGRDRAALAAMRWFFALILERKQQHYPRLRYVIRDVEFEDQDGGRVYVQVLYQVVPLDWQAETVGPTANPAGITATEMPDAKVFFRALAGISRVPLPIRVWRGVQTAALFALHCGSFCVLLPVWLMLCALTGKKPVLVVKETRGAASVP